MVLPHEGHDIEFKIGHHIYFKISPIKGVMRLRKKGKLSPRSVSAYKVSQGVGKFAYMLKLPIELASVHLLFHVSMFKKCIGDPLSNLPIEGLRVNENLTYEEIQSRS